MITHPHPAPTPTPTCDWACQWSAGWRSGNDGTGRGLTHSLPGGIAQAAAHHAGWIAAGIVLLVVLAWLGTRRRGAPAPAASSGGGGSGWGVAVLALIVLAAAGGVVGGVHHTPARAVATPAPTLAPRPTITQHVTHVTVQKVAASPWPLSGGTLALVAIVVVCGFVALGVRAITQFGRREDGA